MTEARYPFVHVDVASEDAETVASALWDLGATGVEERDSGTLAKAAEGRVILVGSFESDADAEEALAELVGIGLTAHIEVVVGDAWRDEWRSARRAGSAPSPRCSRRRTGTLR